MIRTALIAHEIKNNPKKYADTREIIWENSTERANRKWCFKDE